MEENMNGAECLLRTLLANGIDTCFMNPGTSEMQFVAALDRVPAMRGVLCLFEGVCAGAADGYARMLRRPAATLLHLGPGLANALCNFHNARKARSPVVSIVGEHTTEHLRWDAPLTSDIQAFARTVSEHVGTPARAEDVGREVSEAARAARTFPGQVATVIVPADFSWGEAGQPAPALPLAPAPAPAADSIRRAARALRSGQPAGLLLGGGTLFGAGPRAAGRLAAATGARVFSNRYSARFESGAGRFVPRRLAYFPEAAEPMLRGLKHLILVESLPPVSFFGYPNSRSYLAPEDAAVHVLATPEEDGAAALEALVEECGARTFEPEVAPHTRPELPPESALTPESIGRVLSRLLPEGAIVADEMVSSGEAISRELAGAAPFEQLPVTGGAIGQGLPVALGAALACPDRKVVALEADGSGMYTPQSLWTMARERLDVVTVVLANRRYRILDVEMRRTGAAAVGPAADAMMDIGRPALDWVKLAQGHGVEACRAETVRRFADRFAALVKRPGPALIEAVIP
jgi:acetolactate synthase I/II/III large subunit